MTIRSVCVNGKSYLVQETAHGYLKAHLNGVLGWNTVWVGPEVVKPFEDLVRRIKRVLLGLEQ